MDISRGIWRIGFVASACWGTMCGYEIALEAFEEGEEYWMIEGFVGGVVAALLLHCAFRVLIWIIDGFKKA